VREFRSLSLSYHQTKTALFRLTGGKLVIEDEGEGEGESKGRVLLLVSPKVTIPYGKWKC
jgi:hypothetical protein